MKKIYGTRTQDNRDCREVWPRGDNVAEPPAKKRKTNARH